MVTRDAARSDTRGKHVICPHFTCLSLRVGYSTVLVLYVYCSYVRDFLCTAISELNHEIRSGAVRVAK